MENSPSGHNAPTIPNVEPEIRRMLVDGEYQNLRIYREEISDDVARYTTVSESGEVINSVGIPRKSVWTHEVLEEAHRIVMARQHAEPEDVAPLQDSI